MTYCTGTAHNTLTSQVLIALLVAMVNDSTVFIYDTVLYMYDVHCDNDNIDEIDV